MTSLAEILILRGAVPIEALDRMTGDPARDEQWINELIENEQVSPNQVAQARAVFAKLPFIELLEYPVDINAVALVPAAMCRRHEVLPVYMLGDQLTLADLHAAPIIGYFVKVSDGQKLLAEFPEIQGWWARIAARPSFARTQKAD